MPSTRRPNSKARLKKVYSSLYLDNHQAVALRALHERTNIPQQVLLRQGVDLMLERHRQGRAGDKAQLFAFIDRLTDGRPFSRISAKAAQAALKRLVD
jgi:hypothetical protein